MVQLAKRRSCDERPLHRERDVPAEWPPTPPAATVESPTTSPAASDVRKMTPATVAVIETKAPVSRRNVGYRPESAVRRSVPEAAFGSRIGLTAEGAVREPNALLLGEALRGTVDSWDPVGLTDAFVAGRPTSPMSSSRMGVRRTGGDVVGSSTVAARWRLMQGLSPAAHHARCALATPQPIGCRGHHGRS